MTNIIVERLIPYLRDAAKAGIMEYHLQQQELPPARQMPWIGPHLCDEAADAIASLVSTLKSRDAEIEDIRADIDMYEAFIDKVSIPNFQIDILRAEYNSSQCSSLTQAFEIKALNKELAALRESFADRTSTIIIHNGQALACSAAVAAAYETIYETISAELVEKCKELEKLKENSL